MRAGPWPSCSAAYPRLLSSNAGLDFGCELRALAEMFGAGPVSYNGLAANATAAERKQPNANELGIGNGEKDHRQNRQERKGALLTLLGAGCTVSVADKNEQQNEEHKQDCQPNAEPNTKPNRARTR
eukprot:m.235088 g.235088  ORF g.235088 m.235088 type:complete len:127 (-) comp54310_c2_seq2:1187-1567(-)